MGETVTTLEIVRSIAVRKFSWLRPSLRIDRVPGLMRTAVSASSLVLRLLFWAVVRGRCLFPLLPLLIIFFVVEFAYPRFPVTDEIFYKSAGLHLSKGGAFAAPELEGFLHADPPLERVYAANPPLYTWLFGQWTRATGFGWAACVGYDALISAGLAFIIYNLAGALTSTPPRLFSMRRQSALAFLAAMLTLLFRNPGRPDELAMALGFANAWLLLLPHVSPRRMNFISGLLSGLMLCTSVGAFLAFMPFVVALWLRRLDDLRQIVPSLATAAVGGGLATAICLTPLFLAHPYFYQQFFQHAEVQLDELDMFLIWHDYPRWVFILFATLPIFCFEMISLWRAGRLREMLALFVAPLIGYCLPIFLTGSPNYFWFFQPWFLLVAMVVTADIWWRSRSRVQSTVAVGWLAIWLAAASVWPVKDYLVRLTLAPEQRLTPNASKLRELIPAGAGVLTAGTGWWMLAYDHSVYEPGASDIQDLARIEYFVADSNGTGQPGIWFKPENPRYDAMVRENFEPISNTLPRTPLRVFGLRVTNSAYGFGTIVMRRRPAQR